MSNRTRYHSRDRRPRLEPPAPAEDRPRYIDRRTWVRMSAEQRTAASARARAGAAGTSPSHGAGAGAAEHTPGGTGGHPDALGLSTADLAILRPLGKLATVHDMAERLGLPTPARPRPTTTTTAEEARR